MTPSYYIYPDVQAIRRGGIDPRERARLIRRVAARVGDIPSLRRMLGIDPAEFNTFLPGMGTLTPSTGDTIDKFIATFAPAQARPRKPAELMEEAKNHIRSRRYAEALEIISALHLNNPEKSVYFADQIRFLRKLIKNEEASHS